MIRITEISRSESVVRFRLEGRLTDLAIQELRATVEPCLGARCSVLLDLADVTFADRAGIAGLLTLRALGVVLTACSGFLAEMLRSEVAGERRSPRATDDASDADRSYLARLRCGDDAAFAELVERNVGRMMAAAKRLLRNEDEARDAVQDAFMSAFKSIAAFNGEAKLSTWLHRIVVNAALMRLRSRKHRAEQSIDGLLPRFDDTGRWAPPPARLAASSQELLERRETRVIVRHCIDQLPETYRAVLLMRDIDDLDTDEVAELLGITPNAVKIRLHRARQALRTLIEQELNPIGVPAPCAGSSSASAHHAPGA
jgi:RNA polymerase sigma-70 factor (ECF subfamily)